MKFGEFSERVFSMFVQDPDDLKAIKSAEEQMSLEKGRKRRQKKIIAMWSLSLLIIPYFINDTLLVNKGGTILDLFLYWKVFALWLEVL